MSPRQSPCLENSNPFARQALSSCSRAMTVSRTTANEGGIFMNIDFYSDAAEWLATKIWDLAA
jgi:hypothetical protein